MTLGKRSMANSHELLLQLDDKKQEILGESMLGATICDSHGHVRCDAVVLASRRGAILSPSSLVCLVPHGVPTGGTGAVGFFSVAGDEEEERLIFDIRGQRYKGAHLPTPTILLCDIRRNEVKVSSSP